VKKKRQKNQEEGKARSHGQGTDVYEPEQLRTSVMREQIRKRKKQKGERKQAQKGTTANKKTIAGTPGSDRPLANRCAKAYHACRDMLAEAIGNKSPRDQIKGGGRRNRQREQTEVSASRFKEKGTGTRRHCSRNQEGKTTYRSATRIRSENSTYETGRGEWL